MINVLKHITRILVGMLIIACITAAFMVGLWLVVTLATQYAIFAYIINGILIVVGAALIVYGAYDIGKGLIK